MNINADDNTIIVGPRDFLEIRKIKLRDLNILGKKMNSTKLSILRLDLPVDLLRQILI